MVLKGKIKKKKSNLLRIAALNIFKGGEGKLSYISKVINEIDADILGILEAVGWQNNVRYYQKFAADLGYKFFNLKIANSVYNIAVFSKFPITATAIKKNFKHIVVDVKIKNNFLRSLHIFFVHLSPTSENARLLETGELLKYIKSSHSVVIGDLNSLSSHDPYDRRKLLQIFKKNKISKYGKGKLRFDVIKKIESSGFTDAAIHLKYPFVASIPTSSNTDKSHAAKIRIDYAFVTKNILQHLNKIEILRNNIADKASDHYPLSIELQKQRRGS